MSWGPPIIATTAKYELTGQLPGHALYFRVAVVRRRGGQSLWSDPVQVTVR